MKQPPRLHLIAFLGTNNYQESSYDIEGSLHRSKFTQVALNHAYQPDRITIFATTEAQKKHGEELQRLIPETLRLVEVPSCKKEVELWELFDLLTEAIEPGEQILFDVTHGFRAQPLLALLALSYLRECREIELSRVCYGAFDADDTQLGGKPFFDLTPFVSLLDWLKAAHTFKFSGSAAQIAELASKGHRAAYQNAPDSSGDLPRTLQSIGGKLQEAADNLIYLRQRSIAESLRSLQGLLEKGEQEAAKFAKPLLGILRSAVEDLNYVPGEGQQAGLRQIRWLIERGHTQAALTLAREWFIDWLIVWDLDGNESRMLEEFHSKEPRKPYEALLGYLEARAAGSEAVPPSGASEGLLARWQGWCDGSPDNANLAKELTDLRSAIGTLRNDINHAGYSNQDAQSSEKLRSGALDYLERMEAFAAKAVAN